MKVIIAVSVDIIRIGLGAVIESMLAPYEKSSLSIMEAEDRESLVSILNQSTPDIVILEANLVEDNLNSALVKSFESKQKCHWIFFAADASRLLLNFTKEHPDFSIILRNCSKEEIQSCIKKAIKHNQYICNDCIKSLYEYETDKNYKDSCLTPSECTVLAMLAQGLVPKEIAVLQNKSRYTIRTHKRNIFAKLGVKNTLEAITKAYKLKIINPPATE